MGMLALAAVAIGMVTYRNVLNEAEAQFDYQLRQMALSLRDQGEIAPPQADALVDGQLDFVVQIWTVDGRSIYASRVHAALPARALLGFANVSAGDQVWRTFSVATQDRVIQVAQPLAIRRSLAAGTALRSVKPLLWLAPLLMLAGAWLIAMTLRPLRQVAADVRQRDAQSLDPLPHAGLPEEVSTLVDALNHLLQRLSQSAQAQRAFVSDAAHELRSPLTALKLQLQLIRRADDDTTREQAVNALTQGIDRAARLVEQLLVLARVEPGAPMIEDARVDLAEVARQAVADMVPFAISRRVEPALEAPSTALVHGDQAMLTALVRNLVDNAVRYAGAGSTATVRVTASGDHVKLQVDDAGPGIPVQDRERVFDRFYRRNSGGEEGSGLGLAIVRGIAERHAARVMLEDSPLGGLRVSVVFPAAAHNVGLTQS